MSGRHVVHLDMRQHKRERLADVLYAELIQQIASEVYSEGQKLPTEKELCDLFKVSRPVVREALMQLQSDGIVIARQGSGTFVKKRPSGHFIDRTKPIELASFLRTFEVRMAIEGQTAKLAAMRRNDRQLSQIEAAFLAMKSSLTSNSFCEKHDFMFHRAIAAASGNELFVYLFDQIEDLVGVSMKVTIGLCSDDDVPSHTQVIHEHSNIVDAIAAADPDAAELAMRYHLDRTRRRLTDRSRRV